jgi:hypothetical protein
MKCPKCGEILYPINSTSKESECLNKECRYSTIEKIGIYEDEADYEAACGAGEAEAEERYYAEREAELRDEMEYLQEE